MWKELKNVGDRYMKEGGGESSERNWIWVVGRKGFPRFLNEGNWFKKKNYRHKEECKTQNTLKRDRWGPPPPPTRTNGRREKQKEGEGGARRKTEKV